MRPEDCEMHLGQQGIEACDKLDERKLRRYLNYLIQNVQIFATRYSVILIESEMAIHLDAIINDERI